MQTKMDNNGFDHPNNNHRRTDVVSKVNIELQSTTATKFQSSSLSETNNATAAIIVDGKRRYCEPSLCHPPTKILEKDGNWNQLKTIFLLGIIFTFLLWLIGYFFILPTFLHSL